MSDSVIGIVAIVVGVLFLVGACLLAFTNIGMTVDQINQGESVPQFFNDYMTRYIIAIVLGAVGALFIGLGILSSR